MPAATALKKRKVETGPLVPDEREALCDAFAARFAASNAVSAKLEAISRCSHGAYEAEEKLERLRKAISKAQEADAIKAAEAISAGRAVTAMPATTKAERAIKEAQDLMEVSDAARLKLEAELRELEDDVSEANTAITVAITELMRPIARQFIDDLQQSRRRGAIAVAVLSELLNDDQRAAPKYNVSLKSMRAQERREAAIAVLKTAEVEHLLFGLSDADHLAAQEATAAVKKAMADLRTSAATPLPKII
jgi:hypothetical protein